MDDNTVDLTVVDRRINNDGRHVPRRTVHLIPSTTPSRRGTPVISMTARKGGTESITGSRCSSFFLHDFGRRVLAPKLHAFESLLDSSWMHSMYCQRTLVEFCRFYDQKPLLIKSWMRKVFVFVSSPSASLLSSTVRSRLTIC